MRILPPNIDDRTLEQIVQRAKTLAPFYAPEWKPSFEKEFGAALLNIFAYLLDNVLARLNRAADKNFLAFLDMLDMTLLPARSARVPVTFQLAEGALQNVLIPLGTQVSAAAKDAVREELTFETEKNVLVTPAKLQRVLSIVPGEDKIFEHATVFDEAKPFKPFTGTNAQEHILYLSQTELFNFKSMVNIELNINLDESSRNVGIESTNVLWEHWDGKSWLELDVSEDKTRSEEGKTLQKSGTLTLTKQCEGENAELEVIAGMKSRWIRGRMIEALPFAAASSLPKFDTLQTRAFPSNEIFPDLIFSSDVPLNLSKVLPETAMLTIKTKSLRFTKDGAPAPKQDQDQAKRAELTDVTELRKGDFISFWTGNDKDEREIRRITKIEQDLNKPSGWVSWEGDITKDYSIRSNYEITLLTALRSSAFDPGNTRTVRVKSIDGFAEGKRVSLLSDAGTEEGVLINKIAGATKDDGSGKSVPDFDSKGKLKPIDETGNPYFEMELALKPPKNLFERSYLRDDKILLQELEGIFPFGIDPRLFSTFYIASQEAFSKKGASVKLYFEFRPKNLFTETVDAIQSLIGQVKKLVSDSVLSSEEGKTLTDRLDSAITSLNELDTANAINQVKAFIQEVNSYITSKKLTNEQGQGLISPANAIIDEIVDESNEYEKIEPKLSWEYWNGSGWQLLRTNTNNVNHFKGKINREEALIKFDCPSDLAPTEVLGQENFWIRARLVDGDYGKIEFEYDGTKTPPVLKPVNHINPPQI
ncbi:MAG: hypothetical protein AAB354_15635, partial [candidate division KSB1 bacterium]